MGLLDSVIAAGAGAAEGLREGASSYFAAQDREAAAESAFQRNLQMFKKQMDMRADERKSIYAEKDARRSQPGTQEYDEAQASEINIESNRSKLNAQRTAEGLLNLRTSGTGQLGDGSYVTKGDDGEVYALDKEGNIKRKFKDSAEYEQSLLTATEAAKVKRDEASAEKLSKQADLAIATAQKQLATLNESAQEKKLANELLGQYREAVRKRRLEKNDGNLAQLDADLDDLSLQLGSKGIKVPGAPKPELATQVTETNEETGETKTRVTQKVAPNGSGVAGKPVTGGKPIRITSKEERDRLPSGTQYIGPDGQIREKK